MVAKLRERNRAATRQHLAEVAARLFLADGYDEVTLERIAAEGEVSIRTVMRYFESKEQLALAEHYSAVEDFRIGLADPERALDAVAFWRRHVRTYASVLTVESQRWIDHFNLVDRVPLLRAKFLSVQQVYEDLLAEAIAVEDGATKPELPHRVFAATLVYGNLAVLRQWMADPDTDLERSGPAVVDYASENLHRHFATSSGVSSAPASTDPPR